MGGTRPLPVLEALLPGVFGKGRGEEGCWNRLEFFSLQPSHPCGVAKRGHPPSDQGHLAAFWVCATVSAGVKIKMEGTVTAGIQPSVKTELSGLPNAGKHGRF